MRFLVFVFSVGFSLSGFSQTTATPSTDSTANLPKQYVKMEVGMHILDCPVLPPQFHAKLMTVKGVADYVEDEKMECIFFNIPRGLLTSEKVKAMAVSCSFPATAVNVIISDKPFAH